MTKAHFFRLIFVLVLCATPRLAEAAGAADDYFARLSSGAARLSQRDYEGALRLFQEALALQVDGVEAHYYIGVTHARAGRFAKGEESFKRVLALDPSFSPAFFELGVLYYRTGEDDAALALLDRAEKADPKRARVHYYQSLILERQGRKNEATAKRSRATMLDPNVAGEADASPREGVGQAAEGKRWAILLATGIQYDENLILESTGDLRSGTTALEKSDALGVFYFQGLYRWLRSAQSTGDLEYRLYQNAYRDDSLRDFHIQDHRLLLKVSRQIRPIELTLGGEVQYSSLGGDDYLYRYHFGPNVALRRKNILTDLSYRAGRNRFYDADGRFLDHPNRNVKTDRVGLTQSIFWKEGSDENTHIGLFLDREKAGDGPLQDDWSFRGQVLNAGLLWHPWKTSVLTADMGYVIRRFTHPNKTSPGGKRQDDGPQYSATLSQSLPHRFEVSGQYIYQRNNSNIPTFDYRRTLYGLFFARRF